MTSNTNKFLIGSILLTIVLLACVPFCGFILSFVFSLNQNQSDTAKQILAGITSEIIRAFITYYLYSVKENKGSNLIHGIKHGFLYSALIGSLYLILGAFYFQLNSPLYFLLTDTFILTVPGIVSGFILYSIFKEKGNEKLRTANKVLRKAGLDGFDWAFLQDSTFVLRLNFSAKNPRLRKAAKRYGQLS